MFFPENKHFKGSYAFNNDDNKHLASKKVERTHVYNIFAWAVEVVVWYSLIIGNSN